MYFPSILIKYALGLVIDFCPLPFTEYHVNFSGLVKGERQDNQEINRSINTMMTQLSNNSSNQSDNFPTGEKTIKT